MSIETSEPCPCESGRNYGSCCGPIHEKNAGLGTEAKQLMRARYSAYVMHDADFLLRSWHVDTRPAELSFSSGHTWHGLTIVETSGGGGLESDGIVEFKARFKRDGEHFELHERSTFTRVGGAWVYVDGFDPDQR